MSVVVENILRFYGTQKALNNVSFNIPKGQVAGLLGPNGAGKSTLMKILTGYLPPSAGKALVNGFNITEQSLEARRHITFPVL